jgi:capsular exopolysaccharide synthesis family protein
LSQLDAFSTKTNVDNEIVIIQSRSILKEAAIKSNSYITVYSNGRVTDRIQPNFPIRFQPLNPDSLKGGTKEFSVSDSEIVFGNNRYPLKDSVLVDEGLSTPFMVFVNENEINGVKNDNFSLRVRSLESEVGALAGGFKAEATSKQASVVDLSITALDPKLAETALQAILDAYTQASVKDKRLIAEYTLNFIENRLAVVTDELDSVESRIEQFKSANNIFDLGAQSTMFLSSVQVQDAELSKINIQISALDEVERYVNGANRNGTFPSLLGISDPILSTLLTGLYEAETLYNKRKLTAGDRDPELINLKAEIQKLQQGISTALQNVRLSLMSAKRPLESQISARMSELSSLPSKERSLLDISRQQAIKNAIYTFLLQKREESAISYASTLSDVRIIEPALGSGSPVSPKRQMVWLIAFVIGLAVPAAFLIVKERLNSKVLFRSDIEKIVPNLPIIGEIFQTKMSETDLIFVENSRSVMAESIRSVRTKLPFYFTREDEKVLLVSSSIPGEGKSFMASNLGLSIALMGKKTLIVGGDMRKPKLHKTFGISNAIGLSTYLIGKCTVEETIVETEHENLFILPSGPIPPNPSELLVQDRWPKLIEELKIHFDFIILDTPPLGLISDAELMAKVADLSMFVVRHNHSTKEAVRKVLGNADFTSRFPRTVLVFNGLKNRGIGYYGYGYGYGYGYSYGYGGYSYGGYAYGSEAKRTPLLKRLKKRLRKVFK